MTGVGDVQDCSKMRRREIVCHRQHRGIPNMDPWRASLWAGRVRGS